MSPAGSSQRNHDLGSELKGSSVLLKYLMIAVGGAAGGITRYVLGNYIGSRYGFRFPYGTLVINVTGSSLSASAWRCSRAPPQVSTGGT